MRQLSFILVIAVMGTAILLWLGKWQLDRLTWKRGILTEISEKIYADPITLPIRPTVQEHKFSAVSVTGALGETYVRVLASQKHIGAGYRIISPLIIEDRRILVDRGFIKTEAPMTAAEDRQISVLGNLHWPDEIDSYTPDPDIQGNIWFARDIDALAAHLGTDPILIVAREVTPADPAVTPLPVSTQGIPNDHFQYAMTWFSLAAVWSIMSLIFIWRMRRTNKGPH